MLDLVGQLREALRDRYTLERELGRGGMATVWLARDLRHDRLVALKVVITGAIAAVVLWMGRRGQPYGLAGGGLVLVGLVISAALFALAALDGGQIRHDEIRAGSGTTSSP